GLPVSGWVSSLSNFLAGIVRMSASPRSWQTYWIGSQSRTLLLRLTIIINSASIEIIMTRTSGNVTKGMRLVRLRAPGGLENLKLVEEDHPKPRPGELLVRIRASSLNFHDDMVVLGKIPCADGRIPMSDGAGEVIAVGDDVDAFKVADTVVSTFWPYWVGGEMTPATKRAIPGDSVDGYARDYACMPAHAFTKAPAGYTHVEAATLT